jgi:hypothetical protein
MEVRPAGYRIGSAALRLEGCHGSLDAVTDSERRALRPIGTTGAHDVAVATGDLLAGLLAQPGVQIFQGVRPGVADAPCIPHAVSFGRRLVLIESVAWPPGGYTATGAGQVHCDGVYIGQSVLPLVAAARHWRVALPPGHRVSAVVVVHPTAPGVLVLPAARPDLSWAIAAHAVPAIRAQLPDGPEAASMKAVAMLIAATQGAARPQGAA